MLTSLTFRDQIRQEVWAQAWRQDGVRLFRQLGPKGWNKVWFQIRDEVEFGAFQALRQGPV